MKIMDIRGVQRVKAFLGGIIDSRQKTIDSSQDREAQREQLQRRKKQIKLTKEQEQEAFEALVKSLSGTELVAESHQEGENTVFFVKDAEGKIIRELRGLLITDLYIKRFEATAGTLLRKSA